MTRWAAALVAVAALLTGCTDDAGRGVVDHAPRVDGSLTPTACYLGATLAVAPDRDTEVDCAEPHAVEVYGAVAMGPEWPSDVYSYVVGSELDRRWQEWATRECGRLLGELTGVEAAAAALGVAEGFATPVLVGDIDYDLAPPEDWEAGAHETRCRLFSLAGPAAGEWGPTLLSRARPAALGLCITVRDREYVEGPCTEPHVYEVAVRFEVAEALGARFAEGVDPGNVTDEQYQALNELCAGIEEPLVGADRAGLAAYALVTPSVWEWRGRSRAECILMPLGDDWLVGSVLGLGDRDPDLVPPVEPLPPPPAAA